MRLELEFELRLLRRRLLRSDRLRKTIEFRQNNVKRLGIDLESTTNRADVRRRILEQEAAILEAQNELEELRRRNHHLTMDQLAHVQESNPIEGEERHPNSYGYEQGADPVAPEDRGAGKFQGYERDQRAEFGFVEDNEEDDVEDNEEDDVEDNEEDDVEDNEEDDVEDNEEDEENDEDDVDQDEGVDDDEADEGEVEEVEEGE
jgi:hypothetical protein